MVETPSSKPLFKFEAIKFAKSILAEVERARGYDPLSGDDKSGGGNQSPAESRVNAFFRLVGLPMILAIEPKDEKGEKSKSQKSGPKVVRTPGYVKGGQIRNAIIKDSEEVDVPDPKPKTTTTKLRSVLNNREKTLLNREASIGTSQTNKDMEAAFKNPLNLQMDAIEGNVQTDLGRIVFKRMSPFLTSYREIYPAERDLAKPFLSDSRMGLFAGQELKRPFIETVVRIRLISTAGGDDKTKKDYLSGLKTTLSNLEKAAFDSQKELKNVVKILPEKGELLEAFVIEHMLGAVFQLANHWILLQRRREALLKKVEIALVPQTASAKQSPLGKRTNTGLSAQLKNSELGSRLNKLQARIAASEAILGLLPIEDSAKPKGLSAQFSSSRNVMSNALTGPFISILRQDLERERKQLATEKNKLKEASQKADRLRLEMEMMTGEFLGLSVPDIIFTMLGLFLLEQSDLLALLDADTLDEMKKSPNKTLQAAVGSVSANGVNTAKAAEQLRDRVDRLYKLLEAAIREEQTRTKPIVLGPKPKQATKKKADRNVPTKSTITE